MTTLGRGLFNTLIELGEDGRAKPELAIAWEARNGARDWVFALRKGVRFHNGREFDADDALYALNLHRGDARSNGRSALAGVVDIQKIEARQIIVSLNARRRRFPARPDRFAPDDGSRRLPRLEPPCRHGRLHAGGVRTRRARAAAQEPGVLEGRARAPRQRRGQCRQRRRREICAVESRPDRRHQPARSACGARHREIADDEDRSRDGGRAFRRRDGDRHDAVRQRRHARGRQICGRPRPRAEEPVQRLWRARRRSSRSPRRSLFQQRNRPSQARPGEGGVLPPQVRLRRLADAGELRGRQRSGFCAGNGGVLLGERGQGAVTHSRPPTPIGTRSG